MNFNSFEFIVFFPIVVLVYNIVPHRFKTMWLLFVSYFFYMCWNVEYSLLLFTSTLTTYLCGLLMHRINRFRKGCFGICVCLNLMILFVFKYYNLAIKIGGIICTHLGINMQIPQFSILLPVGISFYTFQAIGYISDVYKRDVIPEHNFIKYALFVSFFPQLVAGPIERTSNLMPQFDELKKTSYEDFIHGVYIMLWGFFLKVVIADRIAIFVDTIYGVFDGGNTSSHYSEVNTELYNDTNPAAVYTDRFDVDALNTDGEIPIIR